MDAGGKGRGGAEEAFAEGDRGVEGVVRKREGTTTAWEGNRVADGAERARDGGDWARSSRVR